MLEKEVILPPRKGQGENVTLICREPVVIIGANGSGKSRLGLWIEQHQSTSKIIQRISAQRLLSFAEYIQPKNVKQAENRLYYGDEKPLIARDRKIIKRYNNVDIENEYTYSDLGEPNSDLIYALNDYDFLLSLLIARRNERNDKFFKDCKKLKSQGKDKMPEEEKSPDEKIVDIWNDLLPHRQLSFNTEDGIIFASASDNNIYHAREMSDGERVALYLTQMSGRIPYLL